MRVFIGSSGEQKSLVRWLTQFIRAEYKQIVPVPWTAPWEGGKYTLENLEKQIRDTDASILFWTPDDQSQYHGVEKRYEPRDNLLIEAGMFVTAHGRDRTQLLIPKQSSDLEVAIPSDFWGLTFNYYEWVKGTKVADIETTGLPDTAAFVCDALVELGPRPHPRTFPRLKNLAQDDEVEEVCTYAGAWRTISPHMVRLAGNPEARSVDIMASYHGGEISRVLKPKFRKRQDAQLRACFANMWDDPLAEIYRRKYYDRTLEDIQNTLTASIKLLLGQCRVEARSNGKVSVTALENPPAANYELRLTSQRITMGYYRVDDIAIVVPLDMRREQEPPPLAWVLDKSTAPRAFQHYLDEFTQAFEESQVIYRSRQRKT